MKCTLLDAAIKVVDFVKILWTAEHLEGLIRDKIKQKIGSGNGQVWEAFRLFCGGGDTDEVTPEQFKLRVRAADLVHA